MARMVREFGVPPGIVEKLIVTGPDELSGSASMSCARWAPSSPDGHGRPAGRYCRAGVGMKSRRSEDRSPALTGWAI